MNEPQELEIKIIFKMKHSPGTEDHLHAIAEHYFQKKGITVDNGVIII